MGDGKRTPSPVAPLGATLPVTSLPGHAFEAETLEGARLKHFQLKQLLGRGGMGAVYLAEDTSLERPVALKVLAPEVGVDADVVTRFVREARAQARLRHPNVTQIYFIGEDRGLHFFAMELVDGPSPSGRLERGEKVPWAEALEIAIGAAEGLQAAFVEGFVHRDVKPSNLLVDERGRVKIADFGLVKSMKGDTELTQQGVIVGSPLYMAPEQGRAEDVDHRSDIYSLGCTLYHLITGQPPFTSTSPVAVLSMHVTDRATRIRALAPDAPETVERLVDRMMAKDPAQRFDSYDALLVALRAARPGQREHIGFWRRGAALGADLTIFGTLSLLIGWWAVLVAAIYFVAGHALFGRTVGKWLLGLKVTHRSGAPLSWRDAVIRFAVFAWGPFAWGALGSVVYFLHRGERVSFTLGRLTIAEMWLPLVYASIAAAIFVAHLGGFILAAFHPQKRALHDLAAHTEVVSRE
jgi:uncharacterized RDD family membrane protein YckC